MAQREIDDLAENGIQVVVGVATVPSTPPTSPREEYVYKIATLLLEQPYAAPEMESEYLPLPSKRCLADMLSAVGSIYVCTAFTTNSLMYCVFRNPKQDALFMADQARELGWKVSAIKSDTESKVSATEDDSYWWQFKQKVSVS